MTWSPPASARSARQAARSTRTTGSDRSSTFPSAAGTHPAPVAETDLSLTRLHLMRAGYLLVGVGLALVKWPLLPDAHSLPLFEGVTLCLLILTVTPWRFAWRTYITGTGVRWR